eukprot:GHVL01038349.1.p1 GENE.GHVL01038349.1~~GHVL01038349.1.p1  ORF type:complete len:342 (-),score=24.80 GHVL01038349.1:279-1304(-)
MAEAGYYNYAVDEIRSREFPSLKDLTYVDHAGATLYSTSQLTSFQQDLCGNVYGNPHSGSAASKLTADTVDHVRFRVLKLLNTTPEEYSVIFTSGCTGALKLLAETFSFSKPPPEDVHSRETGHTPSHTKGGTARDTDTKDSREIQQKTEKNEEEKSQKHTETKTTQDDDTAKTRSSKPKPPTFIPLASSSNSREKKRGCFCYLQDNHTSVQGMRELAAEQCSAVLCVTEEELVEGITEESLLCGDLDEGGDDCNCLFAFPGQSNFSGRKYPLSWIGDVTEGRLGFQRRVSGRWFVVLDAASLVSTSPLDLSAVCPDFVTMSFYKIFGFPTGVGKSWLVHD